MVGLRQFLCRHDYQPVERIEDAGAAVPLEVVQLRCSKCGKTRIVAHGDGAAVGQGDVRFGSVRRPS